MKKPAVTTAMKYPNVTKGIVQMKHDALLNDPNIFLGLLKMPVQIVNIGSIRRGTLTIISGIFIEYHKPINNTRESFATLFSRKAGTVSCGVLNMKWSNK